MRRIWLGWLVLALLTLGCEGESGDDDAADDDVADDDAGDDDVSDDDVGDDDVADDDAEPSVQAHEITGEITWSLEFDAVAQAAGFDDCQYHRSYGGVQFIDQPYLCPGCTRQFAGEAEMTSGYDTCYQPVFGGDQVRTEYWGLAWPAVDGGDAAFFRGASENLSIRELTVADGVSMDQPFELAWTSEYALTDLGVQADGSVTLSAAGTATVSEQPGVLLVDPYELRTEPYECGWPLGNPGDLQTDFVLAEDAIFPTAALEDECGERVNLWDFYGSYLVLDSTQPDCGYCLVMADEAPAFLDDMADAGIAVEFVSLLGEGLSNVVGEPTQAAFEDYIEDHGHGGPLVKDRGFGYAMFKPWWDEMGEDLGYPTWAVVRPDMTLLTVGKGFQSWDEIEVLILEDAG
jgi:hypothetical protein